MTGPRLGIAAFFWGFAEATLFFIVPDVLLTAIALRTPRRALVASLIVLTGAVAGGLGMFWWAQADPAAARAAVLAVPAISEPLMARAEGLLAGQGLLAGMIAGSVSGIPYKIFAVEAAAGGVGALGFALASLPARLLRFLLAIGAVVLLSRTVFARVSPRGRAGVLAGFWVVFYAGYFVAMGW